MWITNVFDHQIKEPGAKKYLGDNQYAIATPKPSDTFSCKELREFGMVGLFDARVKDEQERQRAVKELNQVFEAKSVMALLLDQGEDS